MRVSLLILILSVSFTSFGQKKQVCFTYDDMPLVTYGMNDTVYQKSVMTELVNSLTCHKIPATGFVIGRKLVAGGKEGLFQGRLLKTWTNAGLTVGSHTFSHPDYNNCSFSDYRSDLLKGDSILQKVVTKNKKQARYFRHPMLHVGQTKEKADSLELFLKENHFTVAPVTIDNDDYLFALAFKRAMVKNDTALMNQIGTDFVKYIEKKLHYYEQQATALFGRNLSQILLLHASALNAAYVDELAEMFIRNGYRFITLDKALKDPAYQTEVTKYGKWGISWIDRWALSAGKKGDFFKDDPTTPQYIIEQSKTN